MFNVDNGQTFVVVVSEVTPDAGCPGYTVTITPESICGGGVSPTPTATATPTCPPGGGAAGPWIAGNPYPINRCALWLCPDGNALLCVRWSGRRHSEIADVNRMDLATGIWESRAPMPFTSEAPTCALMESTGIVYCAEGDTGSGFASYNIATNTWTPLANTPNGDDYGSASGAFNGKVFLAGGTTGFIANVWVYDVAGNMWSAGTAAPSGYLLAGYHQVGQYLYVVGGWTGGAPTGLTTTNASEHEFSARSMGKWPGVHHGQGRLRSCLRCRNRHVVCACRGSEQ